MSYHVPQSSIVYKYPVKVVREDGEIDTTVKIEMPADAKICLFASQGAEFFVWAYHNTTLPKAMVERQFLFTGTGFPTPEHLLILDHVGSLKHGTFVWHLFEVADQSDNMEENDRHGR